MLPPLSYYNKEEYAVVSKNLVHENTLYKASFMCNNIQLGLPIINSSYIRYNNTDIKYYSENTKYDDDVIPLLCQIDGE